MINKISAITLILVIAISLTAGCRDTTVEDKEIGRSPTELRKEQLLNKTGRSYRDADVHWELGKMYQSEGQYIQAAHEFDVALSFDPVHKPSQAAQVTLLAINGDAVRSKHAAELYINQVSATAKGSLGLAEAFKKERLDEYAFECYQQALNLSPNSYIVNKQIGYYYLAKGERERASDYLVRSFRLYPNQPEVAGTLGRLGIAVNVEVKRSKSAKSLDNDIE